MLYLISEWFILLIKVYYTFSTVIKFFVWNFAFLGAKHLHSRPLSYTPSAVLFYRRSVPYIVIFLGVGPSHMKRIVHASTNILALRLIRLHLKYTYKLPFNFLLTTRRNQILKTVTNYNKKATKFYKTAPRSTKQQRNSTERFWKSTNRG